MTCQSQYYKSKKFIKSERISFKKGNTHKCKSNILKSIRQSKEKYQFNIKT